jgi:hypothetical protein
MSAAELRAGPAARPPLWRRHHRALHTTSKLVGLHLMSYRSREPSAGPISGHATCSYRCWSGAGIRVAGFQCQPPGQKIFALVNGQAGRTVARSEAPEGKKRLAPGTGSPAAMYGCSRSLAQVARSKLPPAAEHTQLACWSRRPWRAGQRSAVFQLIPCQRVFQGSIAQQDTHPFPVALLSRPGQNR